MILYSYGTTVVYAASVVDRIVVMRRTSVLTPWKPEFNLEAFHAVFMVDKVEPKEIIV